MPIIYAIGDLHGAFDLTVPPCDILLVAGDYEVTRDLPRQLTVMRTVVRPWLERQPAEHVVVIGGNHDQTLASGFASDIFRGSRVVYLEDSAVTAAGVKIYGTPWTPKFFDWWFMADEKELWERFAYIPSDTDILLSHGPPRGAGDLTRSGTRAGSTALAEHLQVIRPKAVVCGHIHEGYGVSTLSGMPVFNVSHMTADYRPLRKPLRISW